MGRARGGVSLFGRTSALSLGDDARLAQELRAIVPAASTMKQPRSILVFRPAGLGDFVMSAPAFRALRLRFPDSRVLLLTMHSSTRAAADKVAAYAGGATKAPWAELLVPHLIDEVVTIAAPRTPLALWAAWRALRGRHIDLIVPMIDLGTSWPRRLKKMLFLAMLAGPVRQIGWRMRGTVPRDHRKRRNLALGHHVHGPMQFLQELGEPMLSQDAEVVFDLRPSAEAEGWAGRWLTALGEGARLIAIAPGAAQPHKDWPIDRFVAVARALLAVDRHIHVVVMGSSAENNKAAALVALDPQRISSVCGITVDHSAALFARCELVVGNDGGAVHLADAMGAKVVSIVPGLEVPNSIEPWHNQHRAVRHPVPCAPCYSFTFCPEGHNRCMLELPLQPVLDACWQALAET